MFLVCTQIIVALKNNHSDMDGAKLKEPYLSYVNALSAGTLGSHMHPLGSRMHPLLLPALSLVNTLFFVRISLGSRI